MTLLDQPRTESTAVADDAVIDLVERPVRTRSGTTIRTPAPTPRRGMRIRRVRLGSVASISLVFWLLAYAVLLGTIVAVWNIARAFGLVESFEETMITSLGLDSFAIDGGAIFGVVALGLAVLCLLGWLGTIAMAAVYNATCGVLGGLAVETGPLQRRHLALSWRQRRFVTVQR